jgi:hypothetical protein
VNYYVAHSGAFLGRCEVWNQPLQAHAVWKENQDKLWALSEKLVGEKFDYVKLYLRPYSEHQTHSSALEGQGGYYLAESNRIRYMIAAINSTGYYWHAKGTIQNGRVPRCPGKLYLSLFKETVNISNTVRG